MRPYCTIFWCCSKEGRDEKAWRYANPKTPSDNMMHCSSAQWRDRSGSKDDRTLVAASMFTISGANHEKTVYPM